MSELHNIIQSIKCYLETDKLLGIEELYTKVSDPSCARPGPGHGDADNTRGLAALEAGQEKCRKCGLYRKRTNLVFGTGNPRARLMFVGEAPGAEEDLQGKPFVGRAGTLLTKMIEAMGLRREDVYIANILKCRPPNNRNPLPDEILACSPSLQEQIQVIQPRVICPLGKFAAQFLLKSQEPITALRGRFYDMDGMKVMPTFHPAYLLRNPHGKRLAWEDLKKIRDLLKGSP